MPAAPVELPPTIALLLDELKGDFKDAMSLRAELQRSGLTTELGRQAAYTVRHWQYAGQKGHSSLIAPISPSATLDPFSTSGKCEDPRCRSLMARTFARTMGLYAETITITDRFSGLFCGPRTSEPFAAGSLAPISNQSIDSGLKALSEYDAAILLPALTALRELEPLVRAGIIRFGSPVQPMCAGCAADAERCIVDCTEKLTRELLPGCTCELKIAPGRPQLVLGTPTDPSVKYIIDLPDELTAELPLVPAGTLPASKKLRCFIEHQLRDVAAGTVRELYWSSALAQRVGGGVAVGTASEMRCTGGRARPNALSQAHSEDLENLNSVNLPWIERLLPSEVVTLMDTAASALPRYRSFVASKIAVAQDKATVDAAALELRELACEVEAELRAVTTGKLVKAAMVVGSVGLSVALYATIPTPQLAGAAFAAALSAAACSYPHVAKDYSDACRLRSTPGYLLIRAKGLLEERN